MSFSTTVELVPSQYDMNPYRLNERMHYGLYRPRTSHRQVYAQEELLHDGMKWLAYP